MMELASDAVSAMKGMGKTGDLTVTEAMEGEQAILVFSDAHGSLNISLYGTHYYLYGFEIREGPEGEGLRDQPAYKGSVLPGRTGASSSDAPGIRLQRARPFPCIKKRFRITETLSRYLY